MKQFLYHVTPKENIRNILRDGIKRKGFAVYCSEKPESWFTPNMAIFKIRITGLKHKITTFLPESDEVLIWGDVSPERIYLCKAHEVIGRKKLRAINARYASKGE